MFRLLMYTNCCDEYVFAVLSVIGLVFGLSSLLVRYVANMLTFVADLTITQCKL